MSWFDSLLKIASFIPGPQQPFIGAGTALYEGGKDLYDQAHGPEEMGRPSALRTLLGAGVGAYGAYSNLAHAMAADAARQRSSALAANLSPEGFGRMNPWAQRMTLGAMGHLNQDYGGNLSPDDLFTLLRMRNGVGP